MFSESDPVWILAVRYYDVTVPEASKESDGFNLPALEIMDITCADLPVRTAHHHTCTNLAS